MKKIILSVALAACSLLTIANPINGKQEKIYSYQAEQFIISMHGKVENIKWSNSKDGLIRADFTIDDESISMFFKKDGEYVACTHVIELIQLPAGLRKAVKENLDSDNIQKLIHYMSDKDEAYFAELKEDGIQVIYRINLNGRVEKYKG